MYFHQIIPPSTNIGIRHMPPLLTDAILARRFPCIPALSVAATASWDHVLHLDDARNSSNINLVWKGSGAAGVLVQKVATGVLFVRRFQVQGGGYLVDNRNGLIALCSTVTSVLCIAIQLLNYTWKVTPSRAPNALQRVLQGQYHIGFAFVELIPSVWMHITLAHDVLYP
ncbi:hypothetical protein K440DRAFT_644187 [Wilcoxina mikolae CBS 423.85]|nr:hypothetical protein K440DRAFT_644187 [Wilcoxina mikolae CBS 423.85]